MADLFFCYFVEGLACAYQRMQIKSMTQDDPFYIANVKLLQTDIPNTDEFKSTVAKFRDQVYIDLDGRQIM